MGRNRERGFLLLVAINAVIFFHPLVTRHSIKELFVVSDDYQLELAFLASNSMRESR